MASIKFDFTRWRDGEISGFDLGDITVTGAYGSHSSAGKVPDQSMMIYLALSSLVSGLAGLAERKRGRFEFVGVDSSFSLSFVKERENIVVSAAQKRIDVMEMSTLLQALSRDVRAFLGDPENALPISEAAYGDLRAAVGRLDAALRQR